MHGILNKLGIVKIILAILCALAFIIGVYSIFQIYVGGTDAISRVANWFMAQIGEWYGFPVGVNIGLTDCKIADAQNDMERG